MRTLTLVVGSLMLLSLGLAPHGSASAKVGDEKCPYCALKVLPDTKTQDNRTVLVQGTKRVAYRCVLCAIAEAKSRFKGDLSILAPSSEKGKPVTLSRTGGKWSLSPETALFAYAEGSHASCEMLYRAVLDREAFDAYVKANPKLLKGAKALTLKEMIELSR